MCYASEQAKLYKYTPILEVRYAVTAVGHILTDKELSPAICGHILIEVVLYTIILYTIYKFTPPFKVNEREKRNRSEKKAFGYALDNEDLPEKKEISSNPTDAVSTFDYDKEMVTAELVLSSLTSWDMKLQERQIPQEENIDKTLELLSELLDKSTELEPLMDLEEVDSQANTNNLKTLREFFEKLKKWEKDLISACLKNVRLIQELKGQTFPGHSGVSSGLWFWGMDYDSKTNHSYRLCLH